MLLRQKDRISGIGVRPRAGPGCTASSGEKDAGLPLRYEVESRLGAGRTGVVYLVRDRAKGGARLVLKKLRAGPGGGQGCERLKREFLALSQIHHPNIVGAYDFGIVPGTGEAYFTQDWVRGENILEAARRADVGKVCVWASQVCLALHFLHGQRMVHGDIKPQHILVDESPERIEESVKLIDLGMGRFPGDEAALLAGGTLPYMAPEVADGRPADHRADAFSFGVVLFQILALKYLNGVGDFEISKLGRRLDRMVAAGMPEALRPLLKRMMARSPAERCQDVREAYEVLAGLSGRLQPAPVAARLCVSPAGHPGLIDRMDLLSTFQKLLDGLKGGKAERHCLILSGEAGSGKSRVVEEFRARTQLAGISCAQTRFELAASETYRPFREAIRILCLDNGLPCEDRAEAQDAPIDGLSDVDVLGDFLEGEANVHRKWQALASSLISACSGRLAVLIFEDLHLAAPEELGLWGYLVRALSDQPILLCATYREGGAVAKAVASLAGELSCQELATELQVEHLTDRDACVFVERYLGLREFDSNAALALHKRSGGNPLYLRQIIADVLDRPTSGGPDEFDLPSVIRDAAVPASLRSVIQGRFSLLEGPERDCLAAMAVLNRPVSFGELCEVAHARPQAVKGGFSGLVARGIVRPSASNPERFEFEHSEHTDVAYEDVGPETRREMHRRAAETLETELRSGDTSLTEEVADHYLKAGVDDKAATYCLAAAREAKRSCVYERASRYYAEALKRIGTGTEAYLEAGEEYATVCEYLNRYETVAEWCQRLLRYPISGRFRGSILIKLGAACYELRDFGGAAAAFAEADQLLRSSPETLEFFRLRLRLLSDKTREGHYEEALRGLLRLDRKRVAMGPYWRGRLYKAIARTYQYMPQLQLSRTWYERSLAEYERAEHWLDAGQIRMCLGHVAYLQDRYSDALSQYEAALAQLQPFGLNQEIGLTLHSLGNVAHVLANLDQSARYYREAQPVLQKYGRISQRVAVQNSLAFTQLHLGQFDLARQSIEEAIRLQGEVCNQRAFHLRACQAAIALTAGDAETADQAIGHLASLQGNAFFNRPCEMRLCHLRGWRELAFGSKEHASGLLRRYLAVANELNLRTDICEASLALAQSLGDEADESLQLCQNALDMARETGHGIWELEALFALGRVHYRRADLQRTLQLLLKCVEGCRWSGMKDLRWRALALLAGTHERAGNARYAATYDKECLDILQEIKSQFGSESEWEAFLSVSDREWHYGQVARRVRARMTLTQRKAVYASVS
jgi:tetratricopeptide (TPR) repeat protein